MAGQGTQATAEAASLLRPVSPACLRCSPAPGHQPSPPGLRASRAPRALGGARGRGAPPPRVPGRATPPGRAAGGLEPGAGVQREAPARAAVAAASWFGARRGGSESARRRGREARQRRGAGAETRRELAGRVALALLRREVLPGRGGRGAPRSAAGLLSFHLGAKKAEGGEGRDGRAAGRDGRSRGARPPLSPGVACAPAAAAKAALSPAPRSPARPAAAPECRPAP